MITDEQRKRIEQHLLGFSPRDEDMHPEQIELVRKELLRKRNQRLAGATSAATAPASSQAPRLGLRLGILLAIIALPIAGSLWLGQAQATQRTKNNQYAAKFLEAYKDLYSEDLLTADRLAREAEELLPGRSWIGADSVQTEQVFATARAMRCLFTARLGNADAAMSILRQAQVTPRGDDRDAEAQLLFDICLGKATQVAIETLNGKRRPQEASTIRATGLEFLQSAIKHTITSEYLGSDDKHLLAAALSLDAARIYAKAYPGINDVYDVAKDRTSIAQLLDDAAAHLEKSENRDAAWWTQRVRLESTRIMLQERQEGAAGTQSANRDRNDATYSAFYSEIPEFELAEDYASGLRFQRGVFLSNLADLLSDYYYDEESVSDDVRLLQRSIQLRSMAISNLSLVPLESRTERQSVNTIINHSRRMELFCRLAMADRQNAEAHMLSASLDAAVLESFLGDILRRDIGQLLLPRQMLAAALVGVPEEEVLARLDAASEANRNASRNLLHFAIDWKNAAIDAPPGDASDDENDD